MRYNGGKNYTIKRWGMGDFWREYLASVPVTRFVDGCVGSGAVASFVASIRPDIEVVCNDVHPAAVALLRGVAHEGFEPPTTLTLEEYTALKVRMQAGEVSPLIGFAGFGAAYGGSYFAGYAKDSPGTPNLVAGSAKTITAKGRNLARAEFHCMDYSALPDVIGVRPGDVWYFDKPYEGTTGYPGTPDFDHRAFWEWATDLSQEGVRVLVSEFAAPSGWAPIWSVKRKLESRGKGGVVVERVDQVFTLSAAHGAP